MSEKRTFKFTNVFCSPQNYSKLSELRLIASTLICNGQFARGKAKNGKLVIRDRSIFVSIVLMRFLQSEGFKFGQCLLFLII